MKKNDVCVGRTYAAKVSGKLTRVRLDSESPYGGWNGTNVETNRKVRIKTAARLRYEIAPKETYTGDDGQERCNTCDGPIGHDGCTKNECYDDAHRCGYHIDHEQMAYLTFSDQDRAFRNFLRGRKERAEVEG